MPTRSGCSHRNCSWSQNVDKGIQCTRGLLFLTSHSLGKLAQLEYPFWDGLGGKPCGLRHFYDDQAGFG